MHAPGLPLTIHLHRPRWRRLLDRLLAPGGDQRSPVARAKMASDQRFDDLAAATLKDIGVPPWMQARQQALHGIERARDRALFYR